MEDMQNYSVGHVAIIPDGNRRWAKKHGKFAWDGHQQGAKTFEEILRKALELNVYCVSFWGMSTDNFTKRESKEVKFLLGIFKQVIQKALKNKDLEQNDVRVSIVGDWKKLLPKSVSSIFEKIIEDTKHRKAHVLNLFIAYDGKTEMIRAFKKAITSKKEFTNPKEYLWTRDLPPVDLVIRTGGDPHLSAGFMMWDVADAQLSFSEKLWPDYTPEDFEAAIVDYKKRERRFGA